MPCKAWAENEVLRLRSLGEDARLLHIEPIGAPATGTFLLENGSVHPMSMEWTFHYAVIVGSAVRDESYPDGIDLDVYKSKFTYHEDLRFTILPATAVQRVPKL